MRQSIVAPVPKVSNLLGISLDTVESDEEDVMKRREMLEGTADTVGSAISAGRFSSFRKKSSVRLVTRSKDTLFGIRRSTFTRAPGMPTELG
jgi:hypothetical protein